jgi:hypothetical protein
MSAGLWTLTLDWTAIAAWAGAAANVAVVATAFAVQNRQAKADRQLASDATSHIVRGSAVTVQQAMDALIAGSACAAEPGAVVTSPHIYEMNRLRRLCDHYLSRDPPDVFLVEALMDTRESLGEWAARLTKLDALQAEGADDVTIEYARITAIAAGEISRLSWTMRRERMTEIASHWRL